MPHRDRGVRHRPATNARSQARRAPRGALPRRRQWARHLPNHCALYGRRGYLLHVRNDGRGLVGPARTNWGMSERRHEIPALFSQSLALQKAHAPRPPSTPSSYTLPRLALPEPWPLIGHPQELPPSLRRGCPAKAPAQGNGCELRMPPYQHTAAIPNACAVCPCGPGSCLAADGDHMPSLMQGRALPLKDGPQSTCASVRHCMCTPCRLRRGAPAGH